MKSASTAFILTLINMYLFTGVFFTNLSFSNQHLFQHFYTLAHSFISETNILHLLCARNMLSVRVRAVSRTGHWVKCVLGENTHWTNTHKNKCKNATLATAKMEGYRMKAYNMKLDHYLEFWENWLLVSKLFLNSYFLDSSTYKCDIMCQYYWHLL